jgi:putative chitinase
MTLTAEQIQAGTGAPAARAAVWLEPLKLACTFFDIDSPRRLAAFLAQIGHESGRLLYVREIWGPTPAQARYEGRRDLGNVVPGDGKRFMGRGLIQITGRANYQAVSEGLRELLQPVIVPEFALAPAALELPQWAALSAAWYWHSRELNALADVGDFEAITRRINGGLNGYQDRLALYGAGLKVIA